MFDYDFISKLLQDLLLAILVPLAGFGVNLLISWGKQKKAELSVTQQALVDSAVKIAVFAAEQVYQGVSGAEKKAYALQIAEDYLKKHNVTIDLDALDAAIEAAVFSELNKWKEPVNLG